MFAATQSPGGTIPETWWGRQPVVVLFSKTGPRQMPTAKGWPGLLDSPQPDWKGPSEDGGQQQASSVGAQPLACHFLSFFSPLFLPPSSPFPAFFFFLSGLFLSGRAALPSIQTQLWVLQPAFPPMPASEGPQPGRAAASHSLRTAER